METLAKAEHPTHCSEYVEHNEKKFHIVARNGNAYSHLEIDIITQEGVPHRIANEYDIQGYKHVNYIGNESTRIAESKANITAAKNLIKKVF